MATSTQVDALVALYAGYFNRAPDPAGLQFWIDQIDGGREFNTIAADFAASSEATALYPYLTTPDVATPSTFITSIYQNLFNRAPDAEGLQFWTDVLEAGTVSVADMIEAIINGAVDAPDATPPTFDATTLENKIEVGRDFAEDAANTSGFEFDAEAKSAAIAAIDGVTNDEATVDAAKAATDAYLAGEANEGETFTLTTGPDVLVGTADNDTFNALTVNAAGGDDTTFSAFDEIDGGAGTDTLNIFANDTAGANLNDGFPASGTVKNVEIVNINNIDAAGFGDVDASDFQGAAQIWQAAYSNDVSMLAATTTAGFRKTAVNGVTVTAATGAATAAIALEDIAESSYFAVSGDDLTTVNISGTVDDTNTDMTVANTGVSVTAAKDAQTATVNSAVATSLYVENATGSTEDLIEVDASGSTGNITYMSADPEVATIKTGSGDDTTTIRTATSNVAGSEVAAMVEAGEGDDTITVATTGSGTTTVDAGAGDDTVTLNSDGSGKLSVNLGEGDDSFMVGTKAAVSKGDTIDGGAGTDTVQLKDIGSANIGAFTNFEVFDAVGLNATLDTDILASNNTVTEFVASGAVGGNAALTNVGAGVGFRATGNMMASELDLTQKTAGELTVTLDADSTVDAENDTNMAVNATNATTVNAVFDVDSAADQTAAENDQLIDLDAGKATAINVTSGGTNATNDLDLTTAQVGTSGADALKTVTITGSQALNLEITEGVGSASAVTAIDASGLTGALTVSTAELKAESAANTFDGGTLTLGSGDDVVTIATGANIASLGKGTGEDATAQEDFDVLVTAGAEQAADLADTGTVAIKDGLLTFSGAGPTTLAQAIAQADTAITADGAAVVFEYIGNSYVFINDDTAPANEMTVKLAGATGLNGLDNVDGTNDLYIF